MATKAVTEALEHLKEISSQIEIAVIFDDKGKVVGSTGATDDRAEHVAKASLELLRAAERLDSSGKKVAQLDASTQGRRAARKRERVDLYFVDGTIISVAEGSRGSDRLLQHARTALGATRP